MNIQYGFTEQQIAKAVLKTKSDTSFAGKMVHENGENTILAIDEQVQLTRTILNAIPTAVFITNRAVQILDYNEAAAKIYKGKKMTLQGKMAGTVLHCINDQISEHGCGTGVECEKCVIRSSVGKSIESKETVRKLVRVKLQHDGDPITKILRITITPFEYQQQALAILAMEDISDYMEVRDIVPICCVCKKVRMDDRYWETIESYIDNHLKVEFSHGYCPDCHSEALRKIDNM